MARIKKSLLSWDYDLYTPAELRKLPMQQVKREYTKLRDAVRKRYERLSHHPKYKNLPVAKAYREGPGLRKLRDIDSDEEVYRQLTWLAWEAEEGDSSIDRLEDEERRAKQVTDAYVGDSEDAADVITDEDRGKFWQWIKSKYSNAYLPPSDITDDLITDIMDRSESEHGRKVIFGQWRANKAREGEYKYVRA